MKYELIYLIGASKEAEIPQIKENVEKIITDNGGIFGDVEWVNKRKLAYKIKKDTQGTFIAKRFELEDTEKLVEINSKLRLETGLIRFMISRADTLPELKEFEERPREDFQKKSGQLEVRENKRPEVQEKTQEEAPIQKTEEVASPEKEVPVEETKKKDSAKTSEEEIDKKLEEILNI